MRLKLTLPLVCDSEPEREPPQENHEKTLCPYRACWSGSVPDTCPVGPAFGQTSDYVYVETNIKTPNGNSIAGFVSGANGQLRPIPGSPFLTGGAGTPLGS